MRHLSHALPKVAGQAYGRKYIMLGRIVTSWPEIAGSDLAAKSQPVKIRYTKIGAGGKPAICLDIAVNPSEATRLSYRHDLILQRINALFPDAGITGIKCVPSSGIGISARPRKPIKPLTPIEKTYLSEMLAPIGDAELSARLETLGAAILQDAKS